MATIHLKGLFTVLGKIGNSTTDEELSLSVPIENGITINVTILADRESLATQTQVEVSDTLLTQLESGNKGFDEWDDQLKEEVQRIGAYLTVAARKVLLGIKFYLNFTGIHDQLLSVKEKQWSLDGNNWNVLPSGLSVTIAVVHQSELDASLEQLQSYLNGEITLLFGLRHLHRAKVEDYPRFKWIDATIAAELAIKEFLIRKVPNIEAVLLEVPAPPLHKLYGNIMEHYVGVASPYVSAIRKGAEERNKLVHRPKDYPIACQGAIDYVEQIEAAIYHLLTLLYPDDQIISYLYAGMHPQVTAKDEWKKKEKKQSKRKSSKNEKQK